MRVKLRAQHEGLVLGLNVCVFPVVEVDLQHRPGLITVNRWNRGAPKAFYVILDANQMLSSHDAGFTGAQPLNMVLIVLAICVLWLMPSQSTASSISYTSAHLTPHIWAHKCCCSPGIIDPGHWEILLYYFSHFYHQPLMGGGALCGQNANSHKNLHLTRWLK